MSIATKTGDDGTTGLMYNRRVAKCHPRVEAYGAVDELNAALGLARATATRPALREQLHAIQKSLIPLMGELATDGADQARYTRDGYASVTPEITAPLDQWVAEIEARSARFKGWFMPGETLNAAAFDLARTACRRAERRVCNLKEREPGVNPEIVVFLNRLADLLWLLGRAAEQSQEPSAA